MDATNLPPIRKIGPALLPKPKNIKIHAGRVIRLDEFNGKYINTNDNKNNNDNDDDDEKENSFKNNSTTATTTTTTSTNNNANNTQIENNSNNNKNNNKQMENFSKSSHEAKQYGDSGITLNEYEARNNLGQSDKTSATNTNSSKFDSRNSIESMNRNSFEFPPPPSPIISDDTMSRFTSPAYKDNTDDISNKLSTINLSADGSSRPVITITPRQPIPSFEKEKLFYTIPVQHLPAPSQQQQQQQQQLFIRDTQSPTHQLIKKQPDSPKATNITNKSASPQLGLINNVNSSKLIDDQVDLLMKNLISSKEPNFQGVCYKCKDKILGTENGLKAMEQLFHVTCFTCISCNTFLKDKHFYAIENKSYCENCYIGLLEKCSICMKPIMDRILRATGKPYHPECFCCSECSHNLDGIPFTVDARNKIHCINCFHEKYAPRCYMCQKPITPEAGHEETTRIVAMDKSFHVACYKCEDCGISLTSSGDKTSACYPLDNHVYCKNCSLQRMKRNVKIISPQLSSSGMTPRTTDL